MSVEVTSVSRESRPMFSVRPQYAKIRTGLFAVSATILLSHEFWPDKRLSLVPEMVETTLVSVDEQSGGNSKHRWLNEEQNAWQCYINNEAPYPYCAVIFAWSDAVPLSEINLNRFDHLRMSLSYRGTAPQLKVFFRNATQSSEHLSFSETIDDGQFYQAFVNSPETTQIIDVPLSYFKVADWWLTARSLPSSACDSRLSNAIALGIDIPHPIPLGKHQFEVGDIYVTGAYVTKEQLYAYIISFWALLIFVDIVMSLSRLKNQIRHSKQKVLELSVENAEIRKISALDPLTNLYNRQGLNNVIEQLTSSDLLHNYAIFLIDIDHFKRFNDTYGHTVGDLILQEVADIICDSLRENDYATRWGGEEFVYLLNQEAPINSKFFAERLRKKIANHSLSALPGKDDRALNVSIGGAFIAEFGGFRETFEQADKALYDAKHSGRNRTIIFSNKHDDRPNGVFA